MPRRSTRKRPNDHPEKTQTTLKEPTRKRAKVEPKKKKTTKKVVEEEEDEVMKVEETKVEEMKGEEMKVDSVQTDDDDDFDFDELMELVSPSKKKTTTTSRGKKKGFADSTQDDFIKMLNDMKQEEEKLNEARTSYKKNEGKDLPDTLDDSIEAELFAEDEKFVLTPPILFEKKVDAQAAYDRYNLKRVTERNDISYRTILAKHPYFVGNDTNLISLPTQEDLVASGFMQTLLRQIPVNSIPPFIFDWLFNLICFSRNSTIPGTAFRTLASLISPLPFSFEIDTLSPDLSIIDAMDGSGECKWSVSYSTFVDVLILHGANPEKFGREKEKEEEEEEDSDEEMGKEGEDGEKKKKPLFNSLRQYQLDLFLQLTGLTITASKYKKDASDLPQFLKVCAMLLLDPVGQHTQGSILYTILRALGAFPKFTEEECLSICREILCENVFPHHQHWVKLAQFLPITTRRAKLLKTSVSYCGSFLLVMGRLPTSLFQSYVPVHGKHGTLDLFSIVEKKYNPTVLNDLNEEGIDQLAVTRELNSVLELFDLCIDKKEVVVMAGVKSKREKVLEDYRILAKSVDHFRQTIRDDISHPEKMLVKEVLTRVSQTLGDLLEYLGYEAKRNEGKKQGKITDVFGVKN